MLRRPSLFYLKSFALYGVVLAVVQCSDIQQEHHGVTQFNLAGLEQAGTVQVAGQVNMVEEEKVYPYPRLMNLIEQCRSTESEYLDVTNSFQQGECDVSVLEVLCEKVVKITEKLRLEKDSFAEFLLQHKDHRDLQPYVKTSKRNRGLVQTLARARNREQKTSSYTAQVISTCLQSMEEKSDRLNEIIKQVKMDAEAARIKAEAFALKTIQLQEQQEKSVENQNIEMGSTHRES